MPRFLAAMTGIAAIACTAAALCAARPAAAGALYDMSGLLAEPHPFEVAPIAPPALRLPHHGGAGRNYDMAPALNEPHPFDTPAARPRAAAPQARPAPQPAPAPAPAVAPAPQAALGDIAPGAGGESSFLELGMGYYDINDNESAAEFRAEWRGREFWWKLRPLVGVMATSDAAVYGFGGLAADFDVGERFVVTPSFAAGLYGRGSGKDLGHAIEFRSALEIAWRFDSGSRLGVTVYHISNASIADKNPGTEVLSLGYSIPLD